MTYKVIGESDKPLMVFITGAGIGPYMWKHQVEYFHDYKKILFYLPGHGDNSGEDFTSIKDIGLKLIKIISDESINNKAILIGHSIGAQILMWMLDNYSKYVEKAIIISGLNKPVKGISWLIKPSILMTMPLIKFRSFAKIQSKELSLPEDMFEDYYNDSLLMSKATLINIIKENLSFDFSKNEKKSYADSLVIVGKNEKKMMIRSAEKTAQVLGNSFYYEFDNAAHGIPYEMADELNELMHFFITDNIQKFSETGGVIRCQL